MKQIKNELIDIIDDIFSKISLHENDIFVLGCSTSEILGEAIGQASSIELGRMVVQILSDYVAKHQAFLAVQCCEHLNRSLVVDQRILKNHHYLEEVNARPVLHAGGAAAVAAFDLFERPILVESIRAKAGIDIGDTFIGMHISSVQVPVRPQRKTIGAAHVTAVTSRPKYIGGPRAKYE